MMVFLFSKIPIPKITDLSALVIITSLFLLFNLFIFDIAFTTFFISVVTMFSMFLENDNASFTAKKNKHIMFLVFSLIKQ